MPRGKYAESNGLERASRCDAWIAKWLRFRHDQISERPGPVAHDAKGRPPPGLLGSRSFYGPERLSWPLDRPRRGPREAPCS